MEGLSKGRVLLGTPSCSVCLEAVIDASERSIAKLACGHQFHLDCIGSAFNAKGSMQCPNCRRIENGQWLYASGGHQREDSLFEDVIIEEEYDWFAGVPEFLFPHEYMVGHIQWCPYQGSYAQLSLSVGDADNHPPAYPDLVVNVLVGDNLESSEPLHPCPVIVQTPALVAHIAGPEEIMRVQDTGVRSQQGARHQRQYPSSRGQWGFQPAPALAPIGVAGSVGVPERSRWSLSENHSAAQMSPPQGRYHGRRRPIISAQAQPINNHHPGSQFSTVSWDYAGQFVSPNLNNNREPEPRNNAAFAQRRQEVTTSTFRQHPEGQRWAPPPLSGLYGAHGILGSELPTQGLFGAPTPQSHRQNQASFQAFQSYEGADADYSVYPPR